MTFRWKGLSAGPFPRTGPWTSLDSPAVVAEPEVRNGAQGPSCALENAGLQGSGASVTANLEVAGQILDDGLYFGDSEPAVLALDEAYAAPARERA